MQDLDQDLDHEMDKIEAGLTPDLVGHRVGMYREEFEALKLQHAKANGIDTEDKGEMDAIDETVFRSFVCHKLAAMDTVLGHIVSILQDEEME